MHGRDEPPFPLDRPLNIVTCNVMGSSRRIWTYLLRASAAPFLFSTITVMVLFMLQFLMKMIDQLVGKGLGAWVITQLVALNLAWMVVLAVPMGVLVAGIMAYGNLSSTNEITAMRAAGASTMRLLFPALVMGLVITALVFLFDDRVLPDANHKARVLMSDIQQKKPTFALEPGVISNAINGYAILARGTHEDSNILDSITILDYSRPGMMNVVTARQGRVLVSSDSSRIIFELSAGEIHQTDQRRPNEYRAVHFERHQIAMRAEGLQWMRSSDALQPRGDREMNIASMSAELERSRRSLRESRERLTRLLAVQLDAALAGPVTTIPPPGTMNAALAAFMVQRGAIENELGMITGAQRSENSYLVEIYKKYSIPFACFVFVLAGSPLGIVMKRGTFGVSAGISLVFFVLYWACLISGEKLADRNILSPFMGMWMANLVIGALGFILVFRISARGMLFRGLFHRERAKKQT
jgi:lipopolysaccharide export system permease protein